MRKRLLKTTTTPSHSSTKNSQYFWKRWQKPRVAVMRLGGVIAPSQGGLQGGGLNLEAVRAEIDKAFKVKHLALLVLMVNSPGGSPVQSELIYRYIRHKAALVGVEVLSAVEDVAASGGYMLACAGDHIMALESSIIGSIGVVSAGFGFEKAIEKLGIERRVFTTGTRKTLLDPFLPTKKEDVELLLDLQQDAHQAFIRLVQDRRTNRLQMEKISEEELFSGRIWSGHRALSLGLIDKIGNLDQELYERFGEKVVVKYFGAKKGWFKRKFGVWSDMFWGSAARLLEEKQLWQRYGL